MAFNPEEEVPPENIEMIGRPVQESSCVKTRPWPSSDKQSHNHPGPADTMGINSKPVFAHDEEMTKTGVEEEGLAVCEIMEEAEGVEEGKMEEKAEEKVAEAELGVLCSFEGMPGSCLSPPENMEALPQEAEHQSPTFTAEHEPHLASPMTKPEPTVTAENGPHLATTMTKPEPTLTAENGPHLATPVTKPEPNLTAENGTHLATPMTKPEPAVTAENGPHLATPMTKREPTVTAENGPHLATPVTKREPTVTAENGPHLATPMAEHEHRPDGSTAEGQIKVTDRIIIIINLFYIALFMNSRTHYKIAGQKKVFWKRQKAKPKMQTAEAAGMEGGPRNTRAPFRLQDFMCFKISKRYTVLVLLVLLAFPVNSNETPKQRTCAVCLGKDCANGVTRIYPEGGNTTVWVKANSPTGIQNCSMENLKADAPCKMANGSLVQLADKPLQFEGAKIFDSQILPCANLLPSSTPSPGVPHLAPTTKAPNHHTPTLTAPNDSVADNKDIIIGSVIGSIFVIFVIGIIIGVLIWKRNSRGQGQDGDHRHGNNGVPPHDAEDRDEITIQMQPLNAEVANGNVNGVH